MPRTGARATSTRGSAAPRRVGSTRTSGADEPSGSLRSRKLLWDERARDRPDPDLDRDHRGLGAVGDPELAEDRGEVRLDGLLRQVQALGDITVRPTLGEQREDVMLPLGEAVFAAAAVRRPVLPVRGLVLLEQV